MLVYNRSTSTDIEVIDRWENGFGWFAHPDEFGLPASHVIKGDDGVWLFDPICAPGARDHVEELGTVAGSRFKGAFMVVMQCYIPATTMSPFICRGGWTGWMHESNGTLHRRVSG